MDILQQIQKSQLESLDIFRLKYSLELKSFFGKYYKLFKEAYERAISNKSADYYAYSILHNMVDIIQKKIDIYDFSPDSLGKINDRILAAIIDDDKKQAARLIQAFRQPGIKASLRCFAMAKNPEGHAFVLESLKTAGNQLGVFETVFGDFVNASEEFKRFIIPKVVEHQFYRYKSVVENIAYGYNLSYPIDNAKAFITSLRDILAGDFKKYLDAQDAKTAYMLLNLLRETDKPYQKLFEEMLNDPDKTRRFLAFFYMSRNRADKLELADKYFEQDDLRLYAPLLDCIDGYSKYSMNTARYKAKYGQKPDAKTAKLYRSLYPKLLALWACLPKKNNIFSSTATVWFSHEVKEEEIISKILHILKSLDDKTLIHDFEDNRYDKLSPSDKLLFVTALKDRIKRDYRKEMLNYFTVTEYFNDGYKKYFIDNPLTYAEAVTVSDYLKTKKTDVKKNIVEHFDRMSDGDKARLKAYLEAAPEEYKRECARDIKTDGAKADSKPVAELPKFAFTDLPKDKIREILTAIRAVIVGHKDCEITLNDGEKALFGSQLWLPKADDGKPYFANEVNAAIAAFDLSGGGLVSLLYALYEAAEKDDSPRGKGNAVAALLGEAASQNVFGSDNAVVVNSFLMPYIENYIKDKQTAPLQAEIIKRLTDVYGSIEDFPKKEFNHTVYYGYYSIIKSKDSDKLRTAQHIAALINYNVSDDENLAAMKAIAEYVMAKNACKNNPLSQCILISKWYNAGLASREEIGEYLKRGLFELSGFFETPPYIKNGYGDKALDANIYNGKFSAEFKEIIENVQTEMLETEILRAQAETPYTAALLRCKKYIGVKFYAAVLRAFQKMTLPRDAYGATKDGAFARILERTESRADDSYEAFCALVNEYKLSDKDLIKGVLYNNNQTILDLTAKLLNKPGFISCVMFFKAHLRDSEVSAGVRDKIALFSPIDIADFKEGAVDTDWFFAMKSETPKAVFDTVYENAKYITVGNMHKRAQRFSDALTGKLTAKECLDKIGETRNKEFLLCYSLIPLDGDDDIRTRYETVQRFLLESKQFGAQRQASEKKSCEIALENIARTAGYEDADRFVWYMESNEAHKIAPYFTPKNIDGIDVSLQINDRFKVSVLAVKDGKELSAIPARLKSDKYIAEMKAEIPSLNRQSSRVVKSLESAMERESAFSIDELRRIAGNPVVREILKTLFYVADKKIIGFDGGGFVSLDGKKETAEKAYIAHPLDFFNLKRWEAVQKYLLENKIRQPFKQAFREFYPKTADEIGANKTNRYEGHQIDVQKAVAVAKNRGWHTGEDIGLQKVYYKENLVAVLFGVWDFGYSSFDDHPTISSVYFLNRKADQTGALKIIPLKDIGDKIFSEVMRDIDLIVSTAHPLGYDFEESLSTTEVRRQICLTIIDLLNLSNARIEGRHILIDGAYGEYAVNLNSGNAYKQLSGALNIMTINDSTQNKLFLNFIDDNPKTAEVVSKMLLLADDKKIKDPNIIREIKE